MTDSEMEELVRVITAEVLRVMGEPACSCADNGNAGGGSKQGDLRFDGRVLSAEEIARAARAGKERILVNPETILTPLAREMAQEKGIRLIQRNTHDHSCRTSPGEVSRKVVVLCQGDFQGGKTAVLQVAGKHGYSADGTKLTARSHELVHETALDVASMVAGGEVERLIILDENIYPLLVRLRRLDGVNPVIGWDVEAASSSRACNVLLLHSRLLGIPMIRKIAEAWLEG